MSSTVFAFFHVLHEAYHTTIKILWKSCNFYPLFNLQDLCILLDKATYSFVIWDLIKRDEIENLWKHWLSLLGFYGYFLIKLSIQYRISSTCDIMYEWNHETLQSLITVLYDRKFHIHLTVNIWNTGNINIVWQKRLYFTENSGAGILTILMSRFNTHNHPNLYFFENKTHSCN